MSRKLLSLASGLLLSFGLAGTALAAGPVQLSSAQMDNVTAGHLEVLTIAYANAAAITLDGDHVFTLAVATTAAADLGPLHAGASQALSVSAIH